MWQPESWYFCAYEMDNTAFVSQRSVSSVSTSVEQHDLNNGPSSTKNENEFVNHGEYGFLCLQLSSF